MSTRLARSARAVSPEIVREPRGEVVGAQLQAEPRRDEVVVERRVAQVGETVAECLEGFRLLAERRRDLHALAEVERLERRLLRRARVGVP